MGCEGELTYDKDIIIHISAGPHAQLPDTDSQDHNPNTGNSPGRRYPAPRPLLSRLGHRPARPRVLHRQHQEPSPPQGLRHRRPAALAHELIEARDDKRLRRLQKQLTKNLVERIGHYYRHLAMIFPSRSQLASKQITRTGQAEAVTKEGLAATLLPTRQPDRMGQRHPLRPVRPRSRPDPLRNGSLCCISTRMWALPLLRFRSQVSLQPPYQAMNKTQVSQSRPPPARLDRWDVQKAQVQFEIAGGRIDVTAAAGYCAACK